MISLVLCFNCKGILPPVGEIIGSTHAVVQLYYTFGKVHPEKKYKL